MFKLSEATSNRVYTILKGYGFEHVYMPKNGNCLFSLVSFFILHVLSAEIPVADTTLNIIYKHWESRNIPSAKKTRCKQISWSKYE